MDYEILTDRSRTGRDRPWKQQKTSSLLLSESFQRLKRYNKATAVEGCGSSLKFNVCPNGCEKKLSWSNFCRVRLCPMCQWRRSLLVAHQIKQVCHEAVKEQKMRWLFLTLTCRNVSGEDLSKQIDHLMKAWKALTKRKEFKPVVGWFRAFEVTRNMQDGTYHPHYHVLLGVKPMYFDTGYVKQEDWVRIWGECLEVDYDPVVDIRIVRNKPNKDYQAMLAKKGIEIKADGRLVEADLSGSAVAELAKYSAKSGDFIVYNRYKMREVKGLLKFVPDAKSGIDTATTDEVVATLDDSLARRRLYAFGGLLKEVFARLEAEGKIKHADDPDADLVHVEEKDTQCKCSACASDMVEELYSWIPDVRNYIKKEKVLLD